MKQSKRQMTKFCHDSQCLFLLAKKAYQTDNSKIKFTIYFVSKDKKKSLFSRQK